MKNSKSGMTLVEVIVAIAIVGIIAVGIIPAFAAQFKMTIQSREITIKSFDAQGYVEEAMSELKNALVDDSIDETALPDVTEVSKTVLGRNVTGYRLSKTYPDNANKSFLVYLSKKLAKMEVSTLLVATGVRIEVSGETTHELADLKKTPKPTLDGFVNDFPDDSNWYANIYKWYASKEGDTDPLFPEDYEMVIIPGITPPTLTDITKLANRYVVFTVTPVDIHGVRGNEVVSSNVVYVLGEEWRSGIFAWVDKDANAAYKDDTDVEIAKITGIPWHLLDGFDTASEFRDPADPDNFLDPSDGSLYVPMGIDRLPMDRNGPIDVYGSDFVTWTADKSIHLATDIDVTNGTDISMEIRDGNIVFYQYVELDAAGNAKFDSFGKPVLINYGPNVSAASGSVTLKTSGRGDIILQKYTKLNAGEDITLRPYGHITIYNGTLSAGGTIALDSTKGAAFPGNRDILIRDTAFTLKSNSVAGRTISIASLNGLDVWDTDFNGNTGASSKVRLSASDGIELSGVNFKEAMVELGSKTRLRGGGWDSDSAVRVADGTQLSIGAGSSRVNNAGSLILGNTGGVDFINTMSGDLVNPLTLTLSKGSSDDEAVVSNNYGRNAGFADSSSYESASASFAGLGSGQTNLSYAVEKVRGSGNAEVFCSYDGENTIGIKAEANEPVSSYYRLIIEDKYAEDVYGTIIFKVTAIGPGAADVTVIGSEIPSFTVIYKMNDGTEQIHATAAVSDGAAVNELPPQPARTGLNFNGWNLNADGSGEIFTEATVISGNLTVYAQWTPKIMLMVTFNSNGGSAVAPISVEQGTAIGELLPAPPTKAGYTFSRWSHLINGGNTIDSYTIINSAITAYAQWTVKPTYTVTFYRNRNGSDNTVLGTINVEQNSPIGDLMIGDPARTGYVFNGWWTARSGGTKIDRNTVINGNTLAYAHWTARTPFSDIGNGQYVSIDGTLFQKISSTRLLLRGTIGNGTMNWSDANTLAGNYRSSRFSSFSWITGSDLVDGDTLGDLDRTSIRDIDLPWWGGSYNYNNAYWVNTSGNVNTAGKSGNSYRCRPRITVNNTNLYVDSGLGTGSDPYTLIRE